MPNNHVRVLGSMCLSGGGRDKFLAIALHSMGSARLAAITIRSIDNARCASNNNSSTAISIPSRHHHYHQKQNDSRDTANETAGSTFCITALVDFIRHTMRSKSNRRKNNNRNNSGRRPFPKPANLIL